MKKKKEKFFFFGFGQTAKYFVKELSKSKKTSLFMPPPQKKQ